MWVQSWGLEINIAALLVAAFQAVNALSLVYMLFIALGMGLPERSRRAVWRALLLPALGLLLAWQYAVLVGWPPFLSDRPGAGPPGVRPPRTLMAAVLEWTEPRGCRSAGASQSTTWRWEAPINFGQSRAPPSAGPEATSAERIGPESLSVLCRRNGSGCPSPV